MWPFILSDRLPIVALVGRYPTNKLIGRRPILQRRLKAPFKLPSCGRSFVSGISTPFGMLSPSEGQVAYALLTRSPLGILPKHNSPFDLHVLSTPPAFVLSQDQTLHKSFMEKPIWLFLLFRNYMTWSVSVSENVTRTFIWFVVIQFSRFQPSQRVPDALSLPRSVKKAIQPAVPPSSFLSATSSILPPRILNVNNFLKFFVKKVTKSWHLDGKGTSYPAERGRCSRRARLHSHGLCFIIFIIKGFDGPLQKLTLL